MKRQPTSTVRTGHAEKEAKQLLASIVVVSYNSRNHLDKCLRSVEATLPDNCEVLVVDNASIDCSARYVAERFPHVRLVELPHNIGFAAANNSAVEVARGQFIVALNPDTEVEAGWLSSLLAPFTAESNRAQPIGLTTARIVMMDKPDRVNTCGNNMHLTGITTCRGLGLASCDPALEKECQVSAVSGACFAMPRELWVRLGGLDPDFFMYLEDTDLSLRARMAGYRCVYVPGSVVRHSYTGAFSSNKFYFLERNRLLMMLKNFQIPTLMLLLPALLIAEGITWGYALSKGKAYIVAKAHSYGWLFKNAANVRRKHSTVQENRLVSDAALISGSTWRLDMTQLGGASIGKVADNTINPLFRSLHRVIAHFAASTLDKTLAQLSTEPAKA